MSHPAQPLPLCDYCSKACDSECEHTCSLQCPSCGKQTYHKDCVDHHLRKCSWKTETGPKTGLGGFPCMTGRGKNPKEGQVACKCRIEMVTSIPHKSAKAELKKAARIAAAMKQQPREVQQHHAKPAKPFLNFVPQPAQPTARLLNRPAAVPVPVRQNAHDALTSPLQQDVPGMEFVVQPKHNEKAKQKHQVELCAARGAEVPDWKAADSSGADQFGTFAFGSYYTAEQEADPMKSVVDIIAALGVPVPLSARGSTSRPVQLVAMLKALEDLAEQGYAGTDKLLQVVREELYGQCAPSPTSSTNGAAERHSPASSIAPGAEQHTSWQESAWARAPSEESPAGTAQQSSPAAGIAAHISAAPQGDDPLLGHQPQEGGALGWPSTAAGKPDEQRDQQDSDSDVDELIALCLPNLHKP